MNRDILKIEELPSLANATLVLAFGGWMDGGDVSTGTVRRLVELVDAPEFAEIEPDPFYIYNFPGSMEVTALFRPHIEIEDGLVRTVELPTNTFYCHAEANLVLFIGQEPNLQWKLFGDCIFDLAKSIDVARILFVGSFGGSVPHTRQPRLYVTCSEERLLAEMEKYGVRRTAYEGPGSFTSYLMTRATAESMEMTSLVAEIPGYLQGTNPVSISAVTRRLAQILQLPLELDELRSAGTQWELQVSSAIDDDEEMAEKVRELEQQYDDELLGGDDET